MFELVLFDLDGTLTDSKEGIINCVKYALESFGIFEKNEQTLLKFIGPSLYDSFRNIIGFSQDDAKKAVDKYRERYSDIGIFENKVFPDTKDTLESLKNSGKRLALATAKPTIYAKRVIEYFGISEYFDFKVGAELDGTRSLKYEIIEEVLRIAKPCDLNKTVMVGDRRHDILGAKKCKISSIGLRCGYAQKDELENAGADYIFDSLTQAKDFILGK